MVASGALSVLFLLCLAAVACVSAQSALDYPITYTTCNAGSNCAAGAAGGCRSQQLTQQQQCVSTSSNSLWFTCPTQPQACFRAQYFSDAACTTKILDLYGACSLCQGSYFQANANAFYACGNANGATGVMTISQGCSTTNCTSGCKNVTTVPALGQCVFDGVGYIAVSEIYQCLVAQRQTTIPQGACPTPVPDTTTTLVQGACYSDFTTNNMISVTCNEFVTSPPSTWMTPFTTAAPTQPPPTATVITKAPTAGTTTTAPGVVPPPPPPQTTAVGATLVSRLSCTDQRYCNPSTCTAVLNGTGPNGATLATECVGEGSMNFVKFQCPVNGASSSQCVTVAHYADTACSTVMAEDTLVCNQCFGDGVTSQWLHVTCGSGGITVQTCTDAACTTCSAGATNLATGVCVNSPADTMSVGFAVERGPFACNSILAEFYHYDNTCKANHFASLFIPDGYCRFGNVVTCPSTAPAPSDLPAPSTAVPVVSGESLMLVVSNCADVHCSQSCSTAEAAPTGICDLATFTGELPAADPTASDYTELFECLPSQGQGWVVSLFTNSSCTQVEDQLVLACGICQRSFVTGDYFSLSCGPTLQINQGCDSTCQNCASTRVMTAGQCNQDYAGNYLMPQRHTAFGTLIRHTVYTGVQCRGTPVVSYTSVSGECESRRRLTCANQPPATAPVGDVPSTFEGTFDYPPDAAAFTAALRTFSFQNSASVVFTSSVVSERCGLDMCYVVSFQITGDQATLVAQELYRLRYTHPITLDRWFNMTSLTAAPTDDKQGSSSEVVTVAVVCGVIAFVLFVAAMCFARRRNQKLSKEDILEGEDYVAMSETSSVSSVTK